MPRVGGGFDHCGLDGNDNYVSLSFAGSIQQLNPVPSPLQGRTGRGVTEVGLVPSINVGGSSVPKSRWCVFGSCTGEVFCSFGFIQQ